VKFKLFKKSTISNMMSAADKTRVRTIISNQCQEGFQKIAFEYMVDKFESSVLSNGKADWLDIATGSGITKSISGICFIIYASITAPWNAYGIGALFKHQLKAVGDLFSIIFRKVGETLNKQKADFVKIKTINKSQVKVEVLGKNCAVIYFCEYNETYSEEYDKIDVLYLHDVLGFTGVRFQRTLLMTKAFFCLNISEYSVSNNQDEVDELYSNQEGDLSPCYEYTFWYPRRAALVFKDEV